VIMSVSDWMIANDVISFKIFSSTDASDLPTGWTKTSKFTLDGAVFYDGRHMIVFSDKVAKVLIKDKKTKNHPLEEMQSWLNTTRGATFVGYGSRKFDSLLLTRKHSVAGDHVDLAELVFDASKNHYGDRGRRYDIQQLVELNRYKQTALKHISFLLKPFTLMAEWRMGMSRNVLKALEAEAELIAQMYSQVVCHESLKIIDERTEHPVSISFEHVRDIDRYTINMKEIKEEE